MKTIFELICWLILFCILLCLSTVHADMIKVGVVDTGININDPRISTHLCPGGSLDFTAGTGLDDHYGHGTEIVGLIEQYAKDSNYCINMYKFWDYVGDDSDYLRALSQAVEDKNNIINLSLGGKMFLKDEKQDICQDGKDITFVVAAGNDKVDLEKQPRFPASYGCSNIEVVGSKDYLKSNFGSIVKYFDLGQDVPVLAIDKGNKLDSGTSMSTAIRTGKLIYERSHQKNSNKSPN